MAASATPPSLSDIVPITLVPATSHEQEVILDIRRNNGVDHEYCQKARQDPALWRTVQTLKTNLAQSLQVLSAELYSRPAHFILELVQNADDNSYGPDVEPMFTITLRNTHMEIQCNELGFSEANVRAFCGIGQSTKRNQSGYIGEKGIGAKSIFQVASKVYIRSRKFSFMLDRDAELGMMSPQWDDNATVHEGWTCMRLKFSDPHQFIIVKKQLDQIRETILLFMRRLIHLRIDDGTAVFNATRRASDGGNDVTIYHTSNIAPPTSWRFARVTQTIPAVQGEPKRMNVQTTEIELCFPLDDFGTPWIAWQHAHAFLPLRVVGFKFLIQADFLTAANREDILWDLHWNQHIVQSIASTFMLAIPRFQRQAGLEFEWFRFLPQPGDHVDPLFQPVQNMLLNSLRGAQIVKCQDDVYRPPGMVRLMNAYSLNGAPLLPTDNVPFNYVSTRYADDVIIRLRELGVMDMSFREFLDGLLGMKMFGNQSSAWLDKVCLLLMFNGTSNSANTGWVLSDPRIRNLPLAKLDDGTWMDVSDPSVLFFNPESTYVPPGLGISIVAPHSEISYQRQLLERLGVRSVTVEFIHQRIMQVHSSTRRKPTMAHALDHALWLFDSRFDMAMPTTGNILLPNEIGVLVASNTLYLDRFPELSLAEHLKFPARFLHSSFMFPKRFSDESGASTPEEQPSPVELMRQTFMAPRFRLEASTTPAQRISSWHDWLHSSLGVATGPRVVEGRPVREFADMVNRYRLSDPRLLLVFLRQYWPDIQSQLRNANDVSVFCSWLGGIEVRCLNGITAEMKSTFLPNAFVQLGAPVVAVGAGFGGQTETGGAEIPLLPIDDPENGWAFLRDFGISTEPDARFFLKRLVALTKTRDAKVATVRALYKQLEARFREIPKEIRTAFQKHPLFFIEDQWYHRQHVVWDGPPILTLSKRLRPQYATLEEFFQVHLTVPDADPKIVLNELSNFATRFRASALLPDDQETLFQMLAFASSTVDLIRGGLCKDWTAEARLKELHFIPVRQAGSSSVRLAKMDDNWYLRDPSGQMEELFKDRLDFVALRPAQLAVLGAFISHLGLESKRIDQCVVDTIVVDGVKMDDSPFKFKKNPSETMFYRSRLTCFQRMQHYHQSSVSIIGTIHSYGVNSIVSTLTIPSSTASAISRPCDNCVIIRDGDLHILTVASMAPNRRRGTEVADSIRRALGLAEADLSLVGAIMRYDADEIDLLLRRCGIHELDPELVETLVPAQQTEEEDLLQAMMGGFSSMSRQGMGGHLRNGGGGSGFGLPGGGGGGGQGWGHSLHGPYMPGPFSRQNSVPSKQVVSSLSAFSNTLGSLESVSNMEDLSVDMTTHSSWASNQAAVSGSPVNGLGPSIPGGNAAAAMLEEFRTNSSSLPVGYVGEKLVFDFLASQLPNFDHHNWTSELRAMAGFPGIVSEESIADFTYRDDEGRLTKLLFPEEPHVFDNGARYEYLLEVKSTTGEQGDVFHMSRLQFLQAWRMSQGRCWHDNYQLVYVLLRVSGIGRPARPVLKAYLDPHRLLGRGNLRIESETVDVRIVTGQA